MQQKLSSLLIFLLLMGSASLPAQHRIDWDFLSQVTFSQPDGDNRDPVYGKPVFEAPVREMEGKKVVIEGFMLPLTVDNQQYILSRYPFTECFFCGGGGKETVVELILTEAWEFDLDEQVTVQGRLRLVEDPMQISYRLEEAEPVKR
mgnify:CR=1 FL=1